MGRDLFGNHSSDEIDTDTSGDELSLPTRLHFGNDGESGLESELQGMSLEPHNDHNVLFQMK